MAKEELAKTGDSNKMAYSQQNMHLVVQNPDAHAKDTKRRCLVNRCDIMEGVNSPSIVF
jgi:hypothetical protein